MALKQKIDKATYDALAEPLKAEYKAQGMDYVLDLEGYEDPAELKRAKDREAQKAKDEKARADLAEQRAATAEAALNEEGEAGARKRGDIATLERSWQGKIDAAKAEGATAVGKLKATLVKTLADGGAQALAASLSESPSVLLPHIRSRLTVDFDGEEPALRVLGADGKPSALTVDELGKEFVANSDFAGIITGSKAAGGGAPGGRQGGGGATKKLADMNEKERSDFQKADPEAFRKASEDAKTIRI